MANRNIQFYKDATKILGGDSGKRDYDWRRQMAEALLKTGGSTTPVKSIGEGITRALSGVAGGYFAGEARRSEEEKRNAGRAEAFNMLKAYNAPGGQPAYDAVVNAPMDIDETSDDVDRDAQAAFEQRGGISALSKPTTRGGENMQMALMMDDMQQRQATEAAELKRSQGMEDFGEKQRIKAQYKVDPYQRPYDSTAAIKNAADLKRLRLALENAKGPAAIKRAKQDLSDFEFVLSKTLTAIQAQAKSKAIGSKQGTDTAANRSDWDRASASMPTLVKAVASLRELSKTATYTKGGQLFDYLNRQVGGDPRKGAVDRAKTIAMVKNNVLPLLRQTFGAAFTAAEGDSLLATFGDPDMSPQEKNAVLDALIESKTADLEAKRRLVMRGENPVPTGRSLAPPKASEEDILFTMKKHNMTREQVMQKLGFK
jgi:hypothetical protein